LFRFFRLLPSSHERDKVLKRSAKCKHWKTKVYNQVWGLYVCKCKCEILKHGIKRK
jgi:hypothetical protein